MNIDNEWRKFLPLKRTAVIVWTIAIPVVFVAALAYTPAHDAVVPVGSIAYRIHHAAPSDTAKATDVAKAIALAMPIAKRFEGLRLEPYHDADGYPTVGYGHLLSYDRGAALDRWPRIDVATADSLLAVDLRVAATETLALVNVTLAPHQLAALIDFVFNEGSGRLAESTLLRRLNAGDFAAVPTELQRWVHGDGRVLPGLVERRDAEATLWRGNGRYGR